MNKLFEDLSQLPSSKAEYDNIYNRVQAATKALGEKGRNAKNQDGNYDLWKQCYKEADVIQKMYEEWDDRCTPIYQNLPD